MTEMENIMLYSKRQLLDACTTVELANIIDREALVGTYKSETPTQHYTTYTLVAGATDQQLMQSVTKEQLAKLLAHTWAGQEKQKMKKEYQHLLDIHADASLLREKREEYRRRWPNNAAAQMAVSQDDQVYTLPLRDYQQDTMLRKEPLRDISKSELMDAFARLKERTSAETKAKIIAEYEKEKGLDAPKVFLVCPYCLNEDIKKMTFMRHGYEYHTIHSVDGGKIVLNEPDGVENMDEEISCHECSKLFRAPTNADIDYR